MAASFNIQIKNQTPKIKNLFPSTIQPFNPSTIPISQSLSASLWVDFIFSSSFSFFEVSPGLEVEEFFEEGKQVLIHFSMVAEVFFLLEEDFEARNKGVKGLFSFFKINFQKNSAGVDIV
ncbi:MAG: hypothetical protein R2784_02455 [Saprospiraceae bacterium]